MFTAKPLVFKYESISTFLRNATTSLPAVSLNYSTITKDLENCLISKIFHLNLSIGLLVAFSLVFIVLTTIITCLSLRLKENKSPRKVYNPIYDDDLSYSISFSNPNFRSNAKPLAPPHSSELNSSSTVTSLSKNATTTPKPPNPPASSSNATATPEPSNPPASSSNANATPEPPNPPASSSNATVPEPTARVALNLRIVQLVTRMWPQNREFGITTLKAMHVEQRALLKAFQDLELATCYANDKKTYY